VSAQLFFYVVTVYGVTGVLISFMPERCARDYVLLLVFLGSVMVVSQIAGFLVGEAVRKLARDAERWDREDD